MGQQERSRPVVCHPAQRGDMEEQEHRNYNETPVALGEAQRRIG